MATTEFCETDAGESSWAWTWTATNGGAAGVIVELSGVSCPPTGIDGGISSASGTLLHL
jgi:hypothetical protein